MKYILPSLLFTNFSHTVINLIFQISDILSTTVLNVKKIPPNDWDNYEALCKVTKRNVRYN
jgi:hypothetical protein